MNDTPKDPLDELSDCFAETKDGYRELTWREVGEYCKHEMKLFDSIGERMRLRNQLANDPNYTLLKPMAGLRVGRHGRWRG